MSLCFHHNLLHIYPLILFPRFHTRFGILVYVFLYQGLNEMGVRYFHGLFCNPTFSPEVILFQFKRLDLLQLSFFQGRVLITLHVYDCHFVFVLVRMLFLIRNSLLWKYRLSKLYENVQNLQQRL